MTGLYVRIERDGKWVSVEIETLSDEELARFIERKKTVTYTTDLPPKVLREQGWNWVEGLVKWIRDKVAVYANLEPGERLVRLHDTERSLLLNLARRHASDDPRVHRIISRLGGA